MTLQFRWSGAQVLPLLAETKDAHLRRLLHYETANHRRAPRNPTGDRQRREGRNVAPALHLVIDHGVFLRSNAAVPTGQVTERVAYARGYDPRQDPFESWWIGTSDVAVSLPASAITGIDALDEVVIEIDFETEKLSMWVEF